MTFRRIAVALAALAGLASGPAHAIDGFGVEIGNGDSVDMARVSVQWDWKRRLLQFSDWHLGGYWDLAVGYWHRGSVGPGQHSDLFDLGFTPVFRVQPNGLVGPYVEAAIGFHLLSHTSIGDKRMSTAFQFGDHIGVGYRFGAKSHYDLSYRFQHLSNGGIKHPNPGINFHQIRLQYHF
jgi:lipid A 3-O-deacylase